MGKALPVAYPPELLSATSLAAWKALFDAFAPDVRAPRTLAAVEAYLAGAPTAALAQALRVVEPLASTAGRAALLRAAAATGVDAAAWPLGASDAELAAYVVTRAAKDEALAEALACAGIELFRAVTWPRMPRELRMREGADASAVPPAAALATRLTDALCEARAPGFADDGAARDGASVVPFASGQAGGVLLQVRRFDARGARATDLLEWSPARRALRVETDEPARAASYGAAFGEALSDPTFVSETPTCTLAPLKERGVKALDASAFALEVIEVRLTALRWDSGDADIATFEGRDVFKGLTSRAWHVTGGAPIAAQLRIVLRSGERLSVALWPPNRVHVPRGPHEALLLRVLDTLGFTWTDAPPPPHAPRLWSADPFIHAKSAWPAALGRDFAPLGALAGPSIFASHQVRALAHPSHPHHGRVLVAMPRGDGEAAYGASFDPDVPSRLLPLDTLVELRMDVHALATHLARGLGLEGTVRAIEGRGCFALGTRAFGSKTADVTFLPIDPGAQGASLFELLSLRADQHVPVLLLPPGCRAETDLRQVMLASLAPPYEDALAAIVRALGAGGAVAAHVVAPKGVPLVLDAKANEAWLSGTRIARATELHVRVLVLLAEKGPLTGKEIAAALKQRVGSDSAITMLMGRIGAAFRTSLKEAKTKEGADHAKRLIVHDARGYRLGVPAFVRT